MGDTKTTVGEPKWGFGVRLEDKHGHVGEVVAIYADHAAMIDAGII